MGTLVLLADKEQVTPNQWIIHAHIAVGDCTTREDGRVLLSPDCVTTTELNTWADMFIKELQEIKRQAARLQWDNRPGIIGGRSSPSERGTE